ncbi:MAG TPA: hypothetical protein VGG07_21835, partial [Solirubrobacteraceae bacterium]
MGTQVKSATIGACAVLFVVLVAAAGAQADSFTWLGPTSLITTGGTKALTNVSCTSAQGANTSLCTTVDRSGQEITFDSSTGTIISRATVDLGLKVSSVSCVSSNQCFAVDDGGNELAFNPQNGSPIGAGLNHLEGHPLTSVSCSSATTCVTVDGSGNDVLFNPNNGASHIESIDVAALRAVSCAPMATQCTAVDATGHEITFTPGSTPALTSASIDASNALSSVSCPAANVCTAVDGNGNEVSFDPTAQPVAPSVMQVDTNNSVGVALTGVSCSSTGECVAVDTIGNEITYAPAATPAPAIHPIDQSNSVPLIAVSCPLGGNSCAAVDNHSAEIGFTPGGAPTTPQIIVSLSLSGVDCPSRTQCSAITSGNSEVTFDPTTGAINAAGVSVIDTTGNALTAISCISAVECTAVDAGGNEITFDPTSGSQRNGGLFSLDAVPMTSVACRVVSRATQCVSVETSGDEVTFDPDLTDPINHNTPAPVSTSALKSVACPSATQCTAVDVAGKEVTFDPTSGIPLITAATVDSGIGSE